MEFLLPSFDDSKRRFKAGDILFFQGRGPLAWLIKHFTRPRRGFSHVGLIVAFKRVNDSHEHLLLVDATSQGAGQCRITGATEGVRARPIWERINNYDGDVWCWPLKKELAVFQKAALERIARAQLSEPYSLLEASRLRRTPLGCVQRNLVRFYRWLRGVSESFDAWHCSKLSSFLLRKIGVFACDVPADLSPNSFAKLLAEQGVCDTPSRCE